MHFCILDCEKGTCNSCNGTGLCPACGGTGKHPEIKGEKCPICKGKKECQLREKKSG